MQRILSQHFHFYLALATCLMHLFCCGLPMLLSIGTLAAIFGLSGGEWLHPEWLHDYETMLLIASGALLFITGAAQWISARINCRTDGHCHHEPCNNKKRLAQRLYIIAVGLFAVNLSIMLLTH